MVFRCIHQCLADQVVTLAQFIGQGIVLMQNNGTAEVARGEYRATGVASMWLRFKCYGNILVRDYGIDTQKHCQTYEELFF